MLPHVLFPEASDGFFTARCTDGKSDDYHNSREGCGQDGLVGGAAFQPRDLKHRQDCQTAIQHNVVQSLKINSSVAVLIGLDQGQAEAVTVLLGLEAARDGGGARAGG